MRERQQEREEVTSKLVSCELKRDSKSSLLTFGLLIESAISFSIIVSRISDLYVWNMH